MTTRDRILTEALASFSQRGFEATSLDALAARLGVRKQTILYHFGSKEALLDAVIDASAAELAEVVGAAVVGSRPGPSRLEAVVDAVFRLGARRPELLDLLRETVRLGPPASARVTDALAPLLDQAVAVLPEATVLTAYAMVLGMATEVEVLRSLGVAPDLASLRRRRRQLMTLLADAVSDRSRPGGPGAPGPAAPARRSARRS